METNLSHLRESLENASINPGDISVQPHLMQDERESRQQREFAFETPNFKQGTRQEESNLSIERSKSNSIIDLYA